MQVTDWLKDKFSFSKLNTHSQCPRKFFLRYVVRRREGTQFMVFGRAVHTGMEVDNRAKLEGRRLPIAAVLDAAVESYKKESEREGMAVATDGFVAVHQPQLEKFEESGIRASINPEPGSVEAPFELDLKIGNPETGEVEIPARIEGFVDAISVDPSSGLRTVLDYKTAQRPVSQRDAETSLQFQMYELGSNTDSSRVISFVKGGRQKPTCKATMPTTGTPAKRQKLLVWIADTLRSIRNCLKSGEFPKCAPTCFWCSPTACDYYKLYCYPDKEPGLSKLIQVEKISPPGTVPMPEWRSRK